MERTFVRDLVARQGCRVRVCGWAQEVGAGPGGGPALVLRDPTGAVELVGGAGGVDRAMAGVTPESALEAWGTPSGSGPEGRPRVLVDLLHVPGRAETPLPLRHGAALADRLDWRHLDLRQPRNRLVFEVQTTLERAMRAWWSDHGFVEIHTPKLRADPNRSGRELFTVDYFGSPAYLAQSPQFSKQMAMAAGLERVFEVGPVFRANPLLTDRHDTEFTSVDVEVSWIGSHDDVMSIEESWLRSAVAAVAHEHGDEIHRHFGRRVVVPELPFPRLTMAQARRLLAERGHPEPGPAGDIDAAGERVVAEHVARQFGHELVFVTDYPADVRPFYHMRLEEGSDLTRSFDLLWGGLEVTTGAQREHRHDRLVEQAGGDPARVAALRHYLDFFRHGCPPHGGFGLGLSRVLTRLLGLDDVRETTFSPRDRHRLRP